MNTLRSPKRLLVCGFATALLASSALAIPSDKLAELQAKAEAGNGISQYNLGLVFATPDEPIANIIEAYVWFSLAADNGAPGKALMIVTSQMTPQQISEGKKLLEQRRAALAAYRSVSTASKSAEPVSPSPVVSPVVAAPAEPDNTAIKAELKKASEQLAAATKENQQLKTDLDKTHQAAIDKLTAERDQLAATVATYTNEISAMRAAAANFEGERNALQLKISEASKQTNSTAAAELAATTAKLKTAESELAKADATLNELTQTKQTLATLNSQLQKLTEDNQRLTNLVKETTATSEEKLSASEKALNETNSELLTTQAKLTDVTAKAALAATLSAELSTHRQTNSDLSSQLAKLTAEKDHALDQAAKATTEAQQQIEGLTAKLKASEEASAKALADNSELTQQIAALKSAPPKQDTETLDQLAKLSAELQATQRTALAEKEALATQLKNAEDASAKAASDNAMLTEQLATLRTAPKTDPEAEAKIEKLTAELQSSQLAANSEKETLITQLKTFEAAAAKNAADNANLAEQLATLQAAPKKDPATEAKIEQLSADLKAAERAANEEKKELAAKLKTAEKSLVAATTEREELAQKLKAAKPSKKEAAAQAKVNQLQSELEAVQAEAAKAQASVAELENARKEIADLQAKLTDTEQALALAKTAPAPTPTATTEPVATAAAATESATTDLQKELNETQLKLDASLRSYQLQQAEVDRLQNALANIDNERAKLAERLQAATSEAASAASRATANNDASAQLAGVREQLRQTQNQLASIAYENTELKHRLSFMAPSQGTITPLPAVNLSSAPGRPSSAKPAPVAIEKPATRTHTVVSGDTLSTIAKRYYGSASRWTEILEANKGTLRDPAALKIGMKLKIP